MDRKILWEQGKVVGKRILLWGGGIALVAGSATWLVRGASHGDKHWVQAGKKFLDVHEFVEIYTQAFQSVQSKVDAIRVAEEEARRLKVENAHLRLKVESLQFGCQVAKAKEETKKLSHKLGKETGSRVGRTLASIRYSVPEDLSAAQLLTLGEGYFKARDDEKAAVALTVVTGLEETDAYKTAKNLLMTGIAWYRLDNFGLAEQYFSQVLEKGETEANARYLAQARLWRGLTAAKQSKSMKAQYWLRELIDHHPHSMEAKWVNSTEVERAPASRRQSHKD